jgi:hypothetical protein
MVHSPKTKALLTFVWAGEVGVAMRTASPTRFRMSRRVASLPDREKLI